MSLEKITSSTKNDPLTPLINDLASVLEIAASTEHEKLALEKIAGLAVRGDHEKYQAIIDRYTNVYPDRKKNKKDIEQTIKNFLEENQQIIDAVKAQATDKNNNPKFVSHLVERGADYKKESPENEYTPSREVEQHFAEKRNQNRASQKKFEKLKIPFADNATVEEITKNTPPGSTFEDTDFIYEVTKQKENGVFSFKKTHKVTGAVSATSMKPETLTDKIEQGTMKPSEHKTPENTTEMHDRVTWHKKMKPLTSGGKESKPQEIPDINKVNPTPEGASSKQEKGPIAIGDMFMNGKKHVYKVTGFADDGKIILIRKERGKRKYDSSAVLKPETVLAMEKIEDEEKKGVDSPKEKIGFEKILMPGKKFLDESGHEIIIKTVKKEVFTYTIAQSSNIQTETIEKFNEYIENGEWKEVNDTEAAFIEPDTVSIGASETKWSLKNELKKLGWSDSDIKKLSGEERLHIYENQITVEDASPTEEQSIKQNIPLPRHLEHIQDWKDREISIVENDTGVEFRFGFKDRFGHDTLFFPKELTLEIEELKKYIREHKTSSTIKTLEKSEKKEPTVNETMSGVLINLESVKKKLEAEPYNWPAILFEVLTVKEIAEINKAGQIYNPISDEPVYKERVNQHKRETLQNEIELDRIELEKEKNAQRIRQERLAEINKILESYDKHDPKNQEEEKVVSSIEQEGYVILTNTYSQFAELFSKSNIVREQRLKELNNEKFEADEERAKEIQEEIEQIQEAKMFINEILSIPESQGELSVLLEYIDADTKKGDAEQVNADKEEVRQYLLNPLREVERKLAESIKKLKLDPSDVLGKKMIDFYTSLRDKILDVLRSKHPDAGKLEDKK
jgi:hypothetical protein